MKKRTFIQIATPEEERERVKREAQNLGMSLTKFIRLLIKNWFGEVTFTNKQNDNNKKGGIEPDN